MTKDHGPSIKGDETYKSLRDEGCSKSKTAVTAKAQAGEDVSPGEKGCKQPP